MKRNSFLFLISLLILCSGQSCVTVKNIRENIDKFPGILRAGNKSSSGDPQENTGSVTGFSGIVKHTIYGSEKWEDPVGVQAGIIYPFYRINEFIDLRIEVNISMQGAKWEESGIRGRTNLLYINTPVVARYKTDFGLYAEGGLQSGFLISARKYEGTVENYMKNMRLPDLGIPVGIGYEFRNNFGIDIRIITGFTDITRYSPAYDRNFVMALRGTYIFSFK
ncbi:MAG: PorT family protein [Bacteroidales bacterium]|nr:PorT family protein [Bacteroidales bacterium]